MSGLGRHADPPKDDAYVQDLIIDIRFAKKHGHEEYAAKCRAELELIIGEHAAAERLQEEG